MEYPRVGQLDASILDSELSTLLRNQLWKTISPRFKQKYQSEIELALKLILFKLTIWDHSTTYGAKLQNLMFVNSKSNKPVSTVQKLGYGSLVVGGAYLWSKLQDYLTNYSESEHDTGLRKLVDTLSTAWSVSSLLNFVLFLYSGKYSTLILRLLRIRLAPITRTVIRNVNFEFQNRQLVWNAFTEFLLFILPLLNIRKIKRTLLKYFSSPTSLSNSSAELTFLPQKTCAICYKENTNTSANTTSNDVTNPYRTGECGHIYCYICLQSKLVESEGEGWNCLRCSTLVKSLSPYRDIDLRAVL